MQRALGVAGGAAAAVGLRPYLNRILFIGIIIKTYMYWRSRINILVNQQINHLAFT